MEIKIKIGKSLNSFLKYNWFFSLGYLMARKVHLYLTNIRFSDEQYLKRTFKRLQGYELDLKNPRTLNEKLQWLKINDRKDYHITNADKYAAREYIRSTFGEEYLIPLAFETTNYDSLRPENMPNYPCAVKTNHGFGNTVIIRDKNKVNWDRLRKDYRCWLKTNYYYYDREWQYKSIKPRIIIEKMLICNNGKVPNDYKLNFIEGKLEFIYVSVDREGTNKRNIYDPDWNPLYFTWARKGKELSKLRGNEIQPPPTLQKMIEFGTVIAKMYKYVRVDFYDVDGVLFFGEITQCHGGGFDQMKPFEYDQKFGEKINISIL
jgi:hypothetical protein